MARGLRGQSWIFSDDHAGLGAARKAVFGGVPWQRCQFHLQQNATAYVPRLEQRPEVASSIRAVFNAPDRTEAEARLKRSIDTYATSASKLAAWMESNLHDGLTVFPCLSYLLGLDLPSTRHSHQEPASSN